MLLTIGGSGWEVYGDSALPLQPFCKSKTILSEKFIIKKKKKPGCDFQFYNVLAVLTLSKLFNLSKSQFHLPKK